MLNPRSYSRFLSLVITITLDLGAIASAQALGLGELQVKSALGQPFVANVSVLADNVAEVESSCFKAKVETPDGQFLAFLKVSTSRAQENWRIVLSSTLAVGEPAVKVILSATCASRMQREYFALLDLPVLQVAPEKTLSVDTLVASNSISQVMAQLIPTSILESNQSVSAVPLPKLGEPQKMKLKPRKRLEPSSSMQLTLDSSRSSSTRPNLHSQEDVLRLSSSAEASTQELRLSYGLSSTASQMSVVDLQEEHARLMRLLRDEQGDIPQPIVATSSAATERPPINTSVPLESAKNTYSNVAIWGLGFVCIGSLIWGWSLLRRLRKLEQGQPTEWWSTLDMLHVGEEPENPEPSQVINDTSELNRKLYKPRVEADLYMPKSTALNDEEKIHQMHAVQGGKSEANSPDFMALTKSISVNLEEISDVTQEAEFWVSVNDLPRAIEILEPQVELDDPESPLPWLYLLDLYRATKNRNKYDALKQRFVKSFNAKVTDYDEDPSNHEQRHIEEFTHLMSRICSLWHTDEIVPFLQTLLVDDRDGQREGFELSVYREILFLIGLANELVRMNPLQNTVDLKIQSMSLRELNLDYLLSTNEPSNDTKNFKETVSSKTNVEHQIALPKKFEIAFEEIDQNKKSDY